VPRSEGEAGRGNALAIVWRALSRRDHTVAELRALLERRNIDPADATTALEEVAAGGYLDDAGFARRFAEDRRRLDGWGGERIARELVRRGTADDVVEQTLGGRSPEDELEAARTLLAERHPAPPCDDRERRRALHLLVRRGYELELAYEAVRRHERRAGDEPARARSRPGP
jgi:regulatory protein